MVGIVKNRQGLQVNYKYDTKSIIDNKIKSKQNTSYLQTTNERFKNIILEWKANTEGTDTTFNKGNCIKNSPRQPQAQNIHKLSRQPIRRKF